MVTPESELRTVIHGALKAAGTQGLPVADLYAAVESACELTEEDMQPPMLHGKPVNEPRWRRNVRNTLQSDKDRFRVTNHKRGWWRVAPGPEPGRALDVFSAWPVLKDAALQAAASGMEFQSPVRKRRYQIGIVDSKSIEVVRLDSPKPGVLGRSAVERAVARLNAAGGVTGVGTLINTVALETALVMLHPGISWSPDGTRILAEGIGSEGGVDVSELKEEEEVLQASGTEGLIRLQFHRRRERDSGLMRKFKTQYVQSHGGLAPCEVCKFEFTAVYGEVGRSYIEAHHRTPLSTVDPKKGTETHFEDIAFLCANCHRMAHRKVGSRWLTVEELEALVDAHREGRA